MEKKRILIVDDEDLIRDTCSAMLEALGWECRAVADGEAAIAALSGPTPPDLAIIDINLEGMAGSVLAEKIRESLPSCKIALSSGYDLSSSGAEGCPHDGFIQKPYSLASLGASVRTILEA